MRKRPLQLRMRYTKDGRGGARRGAGRKPNGVRSGVSHLRRVAQPSSCPVHVGIKIRSELPSLRTHALYRVISTCIRIGEADAMGLGMRVVEHSVQRNHVHMIIEAGGREALSRGMQGLAIRIARGINKALQRRGKVFSDRYFAHVLRTPKEVRRALAYVLNNARKHAAQRGARYSRDWIDAFSSAARFFRDQARSSRPVGGLGRTWLLRIGWRRHGLIARDEVPSSA